jgi:orotidine-5'-phosphate decarboxylase
MSNLYGIVCSAQDLKFLKKQTAITIKFFTPGIQWNSKQADQKRTLTPKEALQNGSDCLIMGRSLVQLKDYKEEREKLYQEIICGLESTKLS